MATVTTEQLYLVGADTFSKMKYLEAIKLKLIIATYLHYKYTKLDIDTKKVSKAIDWCKKGIKEIDPNYTMSYKRAKYLLIGEYSDVYIKIVTKLKSMKGDSSK